MKEKFILALLFLSISVFAQNSQYVIMISFDGFRWDYSERGITPNLEKIKKDGVHALSLRPSFPSKTFPNHYSIVTGLHPENHGIIFNSFQDPYTGDKYRLGDSTAVRNSKWYLGEAFWETAERNGIRTASYYWPGSEVKLSNRRPTYYKKYDHNKPYRERIDGLIEWLKLPEENRPRFITLYFHDTDSYGHNYGPTSSEINQSIQRLDSLIGYLSNELANLGLLDLTNLIVVSDHGMTNISAEKVVNIEQMLQNYSVEFGGTKPVMMINPSQKDFKEVYELLKENENHYKVYLKKNLPSYFHFNKNPLIYPIILVADIGWSLVKTNWLNAMRKSYSAGNHGYDNNHTDMHGIFIAKGPQFKTNYRTGTLRNIDIYPLLCKIFKIHPKSNIDGNLDQIEHILK